MTAHSLPHRRPAAFGLLPLIGRAVSQRPDLGAWVQRHRSRADLRALDAHMLRDIGLDWAEARAEARKPFWRA